MEHKFGQMVRFMKDIGLIIRQMARVDLFMQMEMSMMGIGRRIRRMASESIAT